MRIGTLDPTQVRKLVTLSHPRDRRFQRTLDREAAQVICTVKESDLGKRLRADPYGGQGLKVPPKHADATPLTWNECRAGPHRPTPLPGDTRRAAPLRACRHRKPPASPFPSGYARRCGSFDTGPDRPPRAEPCRD